MAPKQKNEKKQEEKNNEERKLEVQDKDKDNLLKRI